MCFWSCFLHNQKTQLLERSKIIRDFWKVQKSVEIQRKGLSVMLWGYVLENNDTGKFRNNQPLFLLIEEMEIQEDNLVFDMEGEEQTELQELLTKLNTGDRLVVRSVEDLADSFSDLVDIFNKLDQKEISLCSCKEPFLSGEEYKDNLAGWIELTKILREKKKQKSYAKAVAEGRVGRPIKVQDIQKAVDLYNNSETLTVEQITAITGVSKSTLYRYLKDD